MTTARRRPFCIDRRSLLAGGASLLAAPAIAQQDWPNRAVKIVVPFSPGGSTDVIARVIAEQFQQRLGQPVVVENKPGAGSTLGTAQVASAPPDGHTLLVTVISAFSVGSTLYEGRINWHPDKSFAHIGMVLRTPYALTGHPGAAYGDLRGMVEEAKRKPGLAYGTSGIGSLPHLVMVRLAQSAKLDLTHVPYRGGAAAVTDLVAGVIPVVLDGLASSVPFLQRGTQMKGLAMTSAERVPEFPAIPTFAEQGYPELTVEGWAGLAAPAGTPRPILEKLAGELTAAMALPPVLERFKQGASLPGNRFLDDMQDFVRKEAEAWRPIVVASGAKPE